MMSETNLPTSPTPAKPRYRRYLVGLTLGILIPAVLWTLAVLFQLGVPTSRSRWPDGLYQLKTAIVETLPSPKLLSVSGSSGYFNIRTETIATRFGMAIANYGTDIELGIDYILWRAQRVASPGDTILLSLEYEAYDETSKPNPVMLDYLFSRDPDYLRSLPLTQQLRFLFSLSPDRVLTGIRSRYDPPGPKTSGYRAETMNAFGDETNNLAANRARDQILAEQPSRFIAEGRSITPYATERLERFLSWAEANEVTVLASFPTTIHFEAYDTPTAQATLDELQAFYRERGIELLGAPQDFFYPERLFYDTRYHLTDRGMTLNTERISELLRPHVNHLAALER